GGGASSRVVADRLTGARVVKAFNTLPAAALASDPHADGGRRGLFGSGDDAGAGGCTARPERARRRDRKPPTSSIVSDSWPSTSGTSRWAGDSRNSLEAR